MFSAKKSLLFLAAFGTLMFLAAPAVADWNEGDGHKMHFPQLPDPNGWDVAWPDHDNGWLGDDWRCSRSGPVEDIHLWVSFKGWNSDDVPAAMAGVPVSVQIWDNNIEGPNGYSIPNDMRWSRTFPWGQYTIGHYGTGEQGWYYPVNGDTTEGDHTQYFQINIDEITNPFPQVEGEVYWLVTKILKEVGSPIGWKTADLNRYPENPGEHFMDDAVYGFDGNWQELIDPVTGASLDLAFVITPEPGTLVLLVTAGLGLLLFAWRRRK